MNTFNFCCEGFLFYNFLLKHRATEFVKDSLGCCDQYNSVNLNTDIPNSSWLSQANIIFMGSWLFRKKLQFYQTTFNKSSQLSINQGLKCLVDKSFRSMNSKLTIVSTKLGIFSIVYVMIKYLNERNIGNHFAMNVLR